MVMKILYGVQTTGNGHISRSREVIRELKNLGHDVSVLLSGRKAAMQTELKDFEPYQAVKGLTFCTDRGKLKYLKTALGLNFFQFYRDIASFDGSGFDLVISDFEPISARIARRNSIPSIGVGHQYAFIHDIPVSGDNLLARFVMKNFAPVDYPVGLHWHHFNHPILPPIVPPEIDRNDAKIENKILVYLPFEQLNEVLALLKPFRRFEFFVYHRLTQAEDNGHLHLRPYSRSGFLNDLIECTGVISNAGFELASEAMFLGKKILVKPLAGQMEQLSNALAIDSLELGMAMNRLNIVKVARFLDQPAGAPIKFPNVARIVAGWIEGGQWEDVEGLARLAWQQIALPALSSKRASVL
jgi:uncharacterized protein (TIGR00661 family)